MKVAGLFAGIGGIEAGFQLAGHHCDLLCEIWPPARAVLETRFREADHAADITALSDLPADTDVVTAGFPCQDLSQAGRTAGISGSRSGLVEHVFRLIDRQRTPVVVLENVPFMLHLDAGSAMSRLVEAFEERGYRWAYRIVNSLAFLPQRRQRVLFVASRCEISPGDVLHSDDANPAPTEAALETHAHGFYWTEGVRGLGWAEDAIPTLKNGSTVGIASPPAILLPGGELITPDIRDAERLQGFDADWTKPAETVGRSSLRWSLVGNAVSVPVAGWLGSKLAKPGDAIAIPGRSFDGMTRWPAAARGGDGWREVVEIGQFPVFRPRSPLADFLRYPGKALSIRATSGFLSRASRSSLRFKPGFLERVAAHAVKMANENTVRVEAAE